jgi:hypothetical protein
MAFLLGERWIISKLALDDHKKCLPAWGGNIPDLPKAGFFVAVDRPRVAGVRIGLHLGCPRIIE